ncbi:MAG: hypothetical protein C4518_05735 [Desulfobacteraceae bacterium]|nr:MAG: hypothetical protein C4518_05735 [Desulfobacteraceae bacterium]
MTGWKITGIIATLIIIALIPIYALKTQQVREQTGERAPEVTAEFTGSDSCKDCHRQEYDKWKTSHHRMAMAAATDESVLGDFDNAEFSYFGVKSRFYRKDGRFFVHTAGPDGKMGEFEITHTFGWYPLQQYLVPFPGGRMQCLQIAWDVKKKTWYHLSPEKPVDPSDWLYWTNSAQNWNGMCAECHSTNLIKGYDVSADTYHTTWSEISVGCEACHGPGSQHVKWARMPDMARPQVENYGLVVRTNALSSRQQVELCAPCHSRRSSLGDNPHHLVDFLDYAIPQVLEEGYYYADGQILEEVYVYGSFTQSKMYAMNVRCSNCHDVHSIKRVKEGNDLCLQCHKSAIYDTKDHHFHKKPGEKGDPVKAANGDVLFDVGTGAKCEQCHMPGRYYMGVDYRPDHSMRIPRPDLSAAIGTPNSCNRCHADKTVQWSVENIRKWYGERKTPHYGTILDAGRKQLEVAIDDLVKLAGDRLYPPIARATALELMASYASEKCVRAIEQGLTDEDSLIRLASARNLTETDPVKRLTLLGPLLYDPIKAVRIDAARGLTSLPTGMMPDELREKYQTVLAEYEQAMEHTADFPSSRHNLGIIYANLGQIDKSVENYRKAIEIDREFYPAKVNLAMVYNQMGKNAEAETLLKEALTSHPNLYEVNYSLGLLLAEEKKYTEAESYLQKAADGLPENARIRYNLGLLQQQTGKELAAGVSLKVALAMEPENFDFLYALADFYMKRSQWEEAGPVVEQMIEKHPDQSIGHEMLSFIKSQ